MIQQVTSGYISEENQNTNSKKYMHQYVHHSIIYHSQDMKATQVPINRVDEKLWYVYTMEYYLAIKKIMKSYHVWQHGWI